MFRDSGHKGSNSDICKTIFLISPYPIISRKSRDFDNFLALMTLKYSMICFNFKVTVKKLVFIYKFIDLHFTIFLNYVLSIHKISGMQI